MFLLTKSVMSRMLPFVTASPMCCESRIAMSKSVLPRRELREHRVVPVRVRHRVDLDGHVRPLLGVLRVREVLQRLGGGPLEPDEAEGQRVVGQLGDGRRRLGAARLALRRRCRHRRRRPPGPWPSRWPLLPAAPAGREGTVVRLALMYRICSPASWVGCCWSLPRCCGGVPRVLLGVAVVVAGWCCGVLLRGADWRHQDVATYWVSMNSRSPSVLPSRPRPLCLVPPKGAAGSETNPRLSPTMPLSMPSASRRPRARSPV